MKIKLMWLIFLAALCGCMSTHRTFLLRTPDAKAHSLFFMIDIVTASQQDLEQFASGDRYISSFRRADNAQAANALRLNILQDSPRNELAVRNVVAKIRIEQNEWTPVATSSSQMSPGILLLFEDKIQLTNNTNLDLALSFSVGDKRYVHTLRGQTILKVKRQWVWPLMNYGFSKSMN